MQALREHSTGCRSISETSAAKSRDLVIFPTLLGDLAPDDVQWASSNSSLKTSPAKRKFLLHQHQSQGCTIYPSISTSFLPLLVLALLLGKIVQIFMRANSFHWDLSPFLNSICKFCLVANSISTCMEYHCYRFCRQVINTTSFSGRDEFNHAKVISAQKFHPPNLWKEDIKFQTLHHHNYIS